MRTAYGCRACPAVARSANVRGVSHFTQISETLMKTKKCPVCDWDVKDEGIKVRVGGKEIVVCCDGCAKKAKAEPAKYAGSAK
jgi:hypothetical protein